MYKTPKFKQTSLNVNTTYIGETIEQKVRRITQNKEPIKDSAPLIYTDRKDGVKPSTNIRTDRFEVAIEALDKASKVKAARRDEIGKKAKEGMDKEAKSDKTKDETGGQSAQATNK